MTQQIDPVKLKAAAEHLEWVCQQYPNDEKVQGLYNGLLPMIEEAKAGRVIEPVADRQDVPYQWAVNVEGLYDSYLQPSVRGAYVGFSTEMKGGPTDTEKEIYSYLDELRAAKNGCQS